MWPIHVIPHFQNDAGVSVIEVGAKELCASARGRPSTIRMSSATWADDSEIICEYCLHAVPLRPQAGPCTSRGLPECACTEPGAA